MYSIFMSIVILIAHPPEVSQEGLLAHLKAIPAPRSLLGGPQERENLLKTEDFIQKTLAELNYSVVDEPFTYPIRPRRWGPAQTLQPDEISTDAPGKDEESLRVRNLIVEIPGRTFPSEVLLVGAHMDGFEHAGAADDNGTGVAALLEVARVLKDEPMERTVRLVFFTLEENGLVGSRHHLKKWQAAQQQANAEGKPEESIVLMVSLEMLGCFTDEPNSQRSPLPPIKGVFEPPTTGNFLAVVSIKPYQDLSSRWGTLMAEGSDALPIMNADFFPVAIPQIMRSDHAHFILAGIPALMVTDTADFRTARYHTSDDVVEHLDMQRFTRAVKGAIHATRTFAQDPNSLKRQTAKAPQPPGGDQP
jgi:hypothetical protein